MPQAWLSWVYMTTSLAYNDNTVGSAYSTWSTTQRALQRSEPDSNCLLRFDAKDNPLTGAFIGEPYTVGIVPDPTTGALTVKPAADTPLHDQHTFVNFFVPWLGVCKVLAGDSKFTRRMVANVFKNGRGQWYSITPHALDAGTTFQTYRGHNIQVEHEAPLNHDVQELVSLVMPYPPIVTGKHWLPFYV